MLLATLFFSDGGAPHVAVSAVISVVFAVTLFCFVRAISEMKFKGDGAKEGRLTNP